MSDVPATHLKPEKILLTGPKGSVGSLLLNSLSRRKLERLVVIDVQKPKKLPKQVVFYKVDLTEPAMDARLAEIMERENVTTVIHSAILWSPTHRRSYAHEVEVIGTLQLLNACHQQNIQKLIVASATLVYGAKPTNPNYLTENHSLYDGRSNRYLRDKVELEHEVRRFRTRHPKSTVTVLRPSLIVGPTVKTFITRFLSQPVFPTILGYDPLIQLIHEDDFLRALHLAIEKNVNGEFNIVGKGVLPLSYAIKLAGRVNLPLVNFIAQPVFSALWHSDLLEFPPNLLDFLRYLWVADGEKAAKELGFVPRYTTRQAMESFSGALRLRAVHLKAPRKTMRAA